MPLRGELEIRRVYVGDGAAKVMVSTETDGQQQPDYGDEELSEIEDDHGANDKRQGITKDSATAFITRY
jgi:hypothetical protein